MDNVRILVALVIVAVWAVIYLLAAFKAGPAAPPELSGVMLAAVTYLFGSGARRKLAKIIAPEERKDQSDA